MSSFLSHTNLRPDRWDGPPSDYVPKRRGGRVPNEPRIRKPYSLQAIQLDKIRTKETMIDTTAETMASDTSSPKTPAREAETAIRLKTP